MIVIKKERQLALLRCSSNPTVATLRSTGLPTLLSVAILRHSPPLIVVRCQTVGQLMSLWATLPRCSPPFVVVGMRASVSGCSQRRGQPYFGVRLPSLLWRFVLRAHRCWAAHNDVGTPTIAVASFCRRAVSNLSVGQPTPLWTALPRRSPPFVIVGCVPRCWVAHNDVGSPTVVVASSRPRVVSNLGVGPPYRGVRLPSWSCGVRRRHWAAHVIVGCRTVVFALSWGVDLGVVVGLAESGGRMG